MLTHFLRNIAIAAFGALAFSAPVAAHHGSEDTMPLLEPGPAATNVSLQGYVDQIVVENQVTGSSRRFPVLAADDGQRFVLAGPGVDNLITGSAIKVSGKQSGRALFPNSVQTIAAGDSRYKLAKSTSAPSYTGVLLLAHADNFDGSPSEFFFALDAGTGRHTRVALAASLGVLKSGMRVAIRGNVAANGELVPESIGIVALADLTKKDTPVVLAAPVTTKYLVIPVKFPTGGTGTLADPWTYGADPFTPAALNTAVFGATGSVQAYYNEVSYGQQLLSGVVANNGSGGFLQAGVAAPACSDYNAIGRAAEDAATAQGAYKFDVNHNPPAPFTGVLYVFNNVPGCGWSGLAYVGYARAWSNDTTNLLVIAHELGHNFGLAHAASLDCGALVIDVATCTSSEYGDPFDVMGNNRAMHFNSAQKAALNWLPAGSVSTHTSGTATYTLSPIESAGGAHYAVKVPASANRTYWIEYRQPIGFDAGLSGFPNNGAQIRVASPFDSLCSGCYDDTEFLDMSPGTAAFTDGALVVGQTYTDTTFNIGINILSQTASTLTIQLTGGGGAPTSTTLASNINPSTSGAVVTFTATVTGTAPSGTVNFTDGGTSIPSCATASVSGSGNARTASCFTSGLAAGAHTIVAIYGGDSGNSGSTSTAVSQLVKSTTNTAVASSANPSIVGASVTFTASVTGLAPTGSVNFTNGGTSITGCSAVALTGSGNTRTAACSTTTLAAGTRSIVGIFSGDSNNVGSTSPTLSQSVGVGTSATSLASSLNPSIVGGSVTLTATVTGTAPTGNVNFKDGATSIAGCAAVTLTGSGNTRTAACSTAAFAVGTHGVTAVYGGDGGNLTSTSTSLSQVVKAVSATGVASSGSPSMVGATVTLTATITGNAPTGNVNFTDGGTSITGCSAMALTGSGNTRTAVCATSALAIGTHSIVAGYGGDSGNSTSTSSTLSQVVNNGVVSKTKYDFNGDGHSDVLWGNASGVYYEWLLNGSAFSAQSLGLPGYTAAGIGDVDGDGKADIVWFSPGTGEVRVWRMNGSAVLGTHLLGTVSAGWTIQGVGDVNGDGKADIVWMNATGQVVAWLSNWNGTTLSYTVRSLGSVGTGWSVAGVADLNGDGIDDIVWFHAPSGSVYAWTLSASGIGSVASIGMVTPGWTIKKVGDFDGDGKADLLWQSGTFNVVWYMDGTSVSAASFLPNVTTDWSIIATGDYDGDGKSDLLWRQSGGSVYQWQLKGRGVAPTVLPVGAIDNSWSALGQ